MEACWLASLAAAIEIEVLLPIRVHDLAHLKLEEELSIIPRGRHPSEAGLRVHASKNDMVVEAVFGQPATQLLLEYLHDFRPLGPHPETDWVFPNRDTADRPRAKGGFSTAITDVVKEHTGVRVNVHAFRAFVAMMILEDNPHAIEDVRAILGHSSFEMAFKHYRRSGRLKAAQRVDAGNAKRRSRHRLTNAVAKLPMDLASRPGSFRPRSFR
jgi:integrase